MELRRNPFKAAIGRMQRQVGLWVTLSDTLAVEMMATLGYDWLLLDTEHSPLDPILILPLLQAVAPYPSHPIVRPSCLDPAEIKKLLDLGAQTILIPMVNSAEEARLAVASVTYPPAGIRGVSGSTRASGFGAVQGYHARASEEICLLVQVETVAALERIEDIAAVPGVDGLFVGPADLAASLGYPGQPGHPEVRAAVCDAIRRIRAAGKPAGVLAVDPVLLAETVEAGAVFVSGEVDLGVLKRALVAGQGLALKA